MRLQFELYGGQRFEVDDVDDYGIINGFFMVMSKNPLDPAKMRNTCGWNKDEIKSYKIVGAAQISEVVEGGTAVIYETKVAEA